MAAGLMKEIKAFRRAAVESRATMAALPWM